VTIKMTHPKSKIPVEVQPAAVQTYESQGWRRAETDAPAGNASLEAWQEYARKRGFSEDDLLGEADDSGERQPLGRDELRAALS